MITTTTKYILTFAFLTIINISSLYAQFTPIGNGSYTNAFPGTDMAGRNGFPSGTPQLSGDAIGKPVPTNDWWSSIIKENHVSNLFNYPLAFKTVNEGLVVSYIVPNSGTNGSSEPLDAFNPITVGVTGLNASRATIADYSDWTATANWSSNSNSFSATIGMGMPFLYFTKNSGDVAEIDISEGSVSVVNETLIITDSHGGADFAIYAPLGSTWVQNGTAYTSTLNGKDYWSMAFIPETASSVSTVANEYKKHAYVFPENTEVAWEFNESTSVLSTTFTVTTDVKEGTETNILLGLLPHQWGNIAPTSPQPDGLSFSSIRGEVKTLDGNTFTVENTFKGILPTLPYLANYSDSFSPSALAEKISLIENDELAAWTDSYNEGQVMNRLIQTARIADQTGDTDAVDKIVATVKERLEDWLTAEAGEVAFIFYYNDTWSAMLGYPAGHGQDNNINDHHFHWGYFIHAAAFMEQYEPGWAENWGPMINLLVRDAASYDRNDDTFPFLRNFNPFAGHSWANGFATFPFGNDQESSSESMQFAASLIHWGTITENDVIRDLGIYIYTTEQTAAEEYWFDINKRTFKPGYGFKIASRIWGNGYDNQTFFTSDIAAAYGIEMYPIHGGSLYLGHNLTYAQELWDEISQNTGILSNEENPNLWHDMMWKYLSFFDPEAAIELYDSYPNRNLKFGTSDAQTYHWLHGMNALGTLRSNVTSDYPIATSFDNNGDLTYVAHNYGDSPITVTFSDGFELNVPANAMATNKDVQITGEIESDFTQAYAQGSVNLTVNSSGSGITKVEFFDGNNLIGEKASSPYILKASNLSLGTHGMYAKIYQGNVFGVTNIISIQVGEQTPYSGNAIQIPGTFEAAHYDQFEGGIGQDIAYFDADVVNQGDFREDQYVDAASVTGEGATLGWITSGEWLEYSIIVESAGNYDLSFRYASGNDNGGGPFHFEIDGTIVSPEISVNGTGDWDAWSTQTASNIELNKGEHVLRISFTNGELNLGKMTFAQVGDLNYVPPVADAGDNVVIILPTTSGILDGSGSSDPEGQSLTYIWEQIYGPSTITFDNSSSPTPTVSNLEEGIYKCKLTVSDGTHNSTDFVFISVSEDGLIAPTVSLMSPSNDAQFQLGENITLIASANDFDGEVALVEFYNGNDKIGEATTEPFTFVWTSAEIGQHTISAKAVDNDGASSFSESINILVSIEVSCAETSTEAIDGSFSTGYTVNFETVGSSVTITFELLDTDKDGVVGILFQEDPFMEINFDTQEGLKFTKTLNNQQSGSTISYACKFAFAGGLAVTKYFSYTVGDSCSSSEPILVLSNATFSIDENSDNQTAVGTPFTTYTGSGSTNYSITAGNADGAFGINSSTGEILVANSSFLDYEATTVFTLTVQATDGNLTDTATITINVNDLPEGETTLSISDGNMSIDEHSANNTIVGTPSSSYNGTNTLTYSITSGNDSGAFQIDANTGELQVATGNLLDFNSNSTFMLIVQVTDGTLTDTATITINVNEVQVELDASSGTLNVDENSPASTVVGTVDVSYTGTESLTFSITIGNDDGIFAIDSNTGQISISQTNQPDYETKKLHILTIDVTDGTLTVTVKITVTINDLDEVVLSTNEPISNVVKIYPNPFNNRLQLSVSPHRHTTVQSVLDVQGRALPVVITQNENTWSFDFSKVTKGIYFLMLEIDQELVVRRIVKL